MFSELNCNTVNIKRVSGLDKYNKPVVSATDSVKGKLEYKYRKITNSTGAEIVSEGTFRTETPLNKNDLIEVNGKYKPFISIQPQDTFAGAVIYWIGWF